MMRFKLLEQGAWRVVARIDHREQCPVEDALNDLAVNPRTQAIAMRLAAIWRAIPREGPHMLPVETYHCVDNENEIYEFIKGRYRVLCFLAEGRMVIAACVFMKKSQKTPKREISKAISLRNEYLAALSRGEEMIVEE
ncbi:hypothetical protein GUL16_16045 [Stenotrophomonas maltophilia]|nr:hypothetical protein [Stenotrophomonas maltophilia]